MRLNHLLLTPVAFLCFFANGCAPGAGPTTNDNTQTNNNTSGNTNNNSNANANDNSAGGGTELTPEQNKAIVESVNAAIGIASAAAGVFPAGDLNDFIDSFGGQDPTCPTVDSSNNAGVISLTLTYGAMCAPHLYPNADLSGMVNGTIMTEESTITLALTQLAVDDTTVDGSFTTMATTESSQTTFDANIAFDVSDTGAVAGHAVIIVDTTNGAISVLSAMVTITDSNNETLDVEYSNVILQPVANGNFLPEAGTAVFTLDPASGPSETITVMFNSQTPVEGTVDFSIQENP